MEKLQKKVGFISLGCDKNRADTETIITHLCSYGFEVVSNEHDADIIVINTCSFLKASRDEADSTIKEMLSLKKEHAEKIIVTGCYAQMNSKLNELYPEVDAFVTPKDYPSLAAIIYNMYSKQFITLNGTPDYRKITTPSHYAYLKIADGCDNRCSYCTIPSIKGKYKSIPIEELEKTAKVLARQGVKELILVAQDTTRYGIDLYKKPSLVKLLQALSKIKGIEILRLHYSYPEMLTPPIIEEMKNNTKIAKYVDIPFQHVSSAVLKAMNRASNEQSTKLIIEMLRSKIPDVAIRSTFIVGFPGESSKDFKKLIAFLKEYKLDNVGFFAYSREEGTSSYNLRQIKDSLKQKRLRIAQKVQQKIAFNNNKRYLNTTQRVLCDGYIEEEKLYYGRNYAMSPDVDFIIYFEGNSKIGEFVNVEIVQVLTDYLIGKVAEDNYESTK